MIADMMVPTNSQPAHVHIQIMVWLGMVQLHNIILTTSRTKQGSGQNKKCKQKATN